MLKKLRNQFLLVTMTLVSIMLVVIFCLVYSFTSANLENQSRQVAERAAQSAGQLTIHTIRPDEGLPVFTIRRNLFGHITASGMSYYDLTNEEFVMALLVQVEQTESQTGVLEAYNLRFHREQNCIAFVDISSQEATLRSLIKTSVIIGAASFVLFYILGFLLAKWVVRPVERAWEQQKQFVSDASHELKTPLTVIIGNAELQAQGEDTQKYNRNILAAAGQMRSLVEGLLELARADNGQVKAHFAPLDLSRLVRDICLAFEAVFFEKGLHLETDIEENVCVIGNARYLYQVTDILLDNAGKYSDPGVVCVGLRRQGSQCLLTVKNPGQPIPKQEQEQIFRRFYRMDKARSGKDGFGLGLSIAKSVVEEHAGKIWVQTTPDSNCFCVQIPMAKEKR